MFRAILDLFREDPLMGVNSQHYVQDWKRRLVDDDADSYILSELRKLVPFSS